MMEVYICDGLHEHLPHPTIYSIYLLVYIKIYVKQYVYAVFFPNIKNYFVIEKMRFFGKLWLLYFSSTKNVQKNTINSYFISWI